MAIIKMNISLGFFVYTRTNLAPNQTYLLIHATQHIYKLTWLEATMLCADLLR